MKLSLVIPFIDNVDITKHCIETAVKNVKLGSTFCDFELVLLDNGSDKANSKIIKKYADAMAADGLFIRNEENVGVLPSFKQAFQETDSDIICFIHNDVLIHQEDWVNMVVHAFTTVPNLGLAGIFGAVGVGENGGRIRSQSQMLGLEWGACQCHSVAWQHHSEFMDGISPAAILDGVGMFFSRQAANNLMETDMFDSWRAPHHFYDRIIPLKLIDKGFKIATIGLGFDHWSGATANSSGKYITTGLNWLKENNKYVEGEAVDSQIYNIAEQQFFGEFGKRIPCYVHSDWNYEWRGLA
jgi:glycosyltransferase involved in cell wall biosynthesis